MGRTWMAIDAFVVVLFVGIGRAHHHHALNWSGMWSTTWPFALGLAVGWLGVLVRRQRGSSTRSGVAIWLSVVVVGMIARVVAGQGTAMAFILVALGFLGVLMLGSRVISARYLRGRGERKSSPLA